MDKKDGEVGYLPNVGREMLFCTTPSMEEPPVVTFDGNSEDWPESLKIATGKDTVGDLYAFRDAENLYVLSFIQSGDWTTNYAVSTNLFIDADGDSKTGYQATPTFKVSGADFLVQDWNSNTDAKNVEFFKASGTSGWTKIGDQSSGYEYKKFVDREYANGEVVACEWVVPISVMEAQIGNVSSDIYVAVDRQTESLQGGTGTGYAPANASFAAVPKFRVGVKVKVDDGSFADWDSVTNRAYNTSLDSTCNLVATRSADRLYTLVTSDAVDVSNVTWHMFKVHVENLEPGSYWFFRVGLKDKGFSEVGSFKIEEAETDKLTFVHLTDCQEGNQSGYTRWAKVLDAAYQMAPDSKFVAFTGDLTNDSHANLTMTQWNWGLGEPKKNLLNTVIMPSSGNHDEWEYSFTDRFDIKWADYIKAGGVHPVNGKTYTDDQENLDIKAGGCYSFMYGDDIAFINLNTNDTNNLPDDFQSQYNWLPSLITHC